MTIVLRKIKCTVSYDGTKYAGYQTQTNAVTVQQKIETALQRITKERTPIISSGRTDAGVHAKGQVFHFQSTCAVPVEKWPFAFSAQLPADIVVLDAIEVPDSFHARYNAKEKTYRYCIVNSQFSDVFIRQYAWHIPQKLNMQAMQEAANHLIGEHDFTSFCSVRTEKENKVRKLVEISLDEEREGQLWITFRGNGFLYNMVRIIVGTLVKVGLGTWSVDSMPIILAAQSRKKAGQTAPAQGLFLWKVDY